MTKRTLTLITVLAVIIAANTSIQGRQDAALSAATRQKLVASLGKGAAYLHQQQKPDGKCENHPGITAMAAAGAAAPAGRDATRSSRPSARRSTICKSLAKPDGGIYDKDDSALHHRGRGAGARRRRARRRQADHREGAQVPRRSSAR